MRQREQIYMHIMQAPVQNRKIIMEKVAKCFAEKFAYEYNQIFLFVIYAASFDNKHTKSKCDEVDM